MEAKLTSFVCARIYQISEQYINFTGKGRIFNIDAIH